MGFKFGTFESICAVAPLQVCPLLGTAHGQEPHCYSRNVELSGTLIFQPGVSFVHIVALIMTVIMIAHIRSKYTAVGRKEIVTFFYMYLVIELLGLFIDSAIIPTSNSVYPWFAGIHVALIVASFWCLVVNGFVGFQFAEDGTPMSLWFLRLSSLVVFGVSFFIAIATFKEVASFSYTKPLGLFIVYLLFPLVCVAVYVVSQLVLVIRTLDDRWVIGDILFGTGFFTIGAVLLFAFSVTICDAVEHYIDGLFFFVLCMLLSVMMVYKYWDSITKEDLEFAVGDKGSVWEVKDPLLAHPQPMDYPDDDSYYPQAPSSGSLMNGASGQNYYQSSSSSPRLGSSPSGLHQQASYGYPPPLKGSVSGLSNSSEGSSKGWYNQPSPRREDLPPVPVASAGYHQSREARGPNQARY